MMELEIKGTDHKDVVKKYTYNLQVDHYNITIFIVECIDLL
jgi:hypothetical protein